MNNQTPINLQPELFVRRLPAGSWDMVLIRDGIKGRHIGFDYNATYDRALKDLEEKENAAKI